jgi:flagellar biosynthetic protein FliQ
MSDALVVDLARQAMLMALTLIVGLLVSVLQAVTQIQEQTLAFVPKLVVVGLVFLIGLPWLIHSAVKYTSELFRAIPTLVG